MDYYQHSYAEFQGGQSGFGDRLQPYKSVRRGAAVAEIRGGPLAPEITGRVTFVPAVGGTEVSTEVYGLPLYQPAQGEEPPIGPFAYHMHEYSECTVGDPANPFQAAGGHWNPTNQPHGNHAGDFPVLFSNNGYAKMTFFTDKFTVDDIIGKTVIIHEHPDDYKTQPDGPGGPRLACGVITYYY